MNCIGPRTARPRHSLAASVGAAHRRPHVRVKGQLTPWKMYEKLESENMQKTAVFYVYVIFWEQSGQEGVEKGAMLTTYLFRYTSECTIALSNFQNFLRVRRQGGIDRLTKILRTFLVLPPGKSFRVYTGHDQSWGLFTDTTPKHYFLRLTLDVASVLLLNGENIMRKTDYCSLYPRDVMTVGMRCPEPSTKSMHTASS